MEKTAVRWSLRITVALAAAIACLALSATSAFAVGHYANLNGATMGVVGGNNPSYVLVKYPKSCDDSTWMNEIVLNNEDDADFTFKSTKPKVVTAKKKNGNLHLYLKKAGKAKVAYWMGSEKYVLNITVVNYQNPLKTFTVGGKNLASKLKKDNILESSDYFKGVFLPAGKLKVAPASGWVVKEILLGYPDKVVKNGFKMKKGTWSYLIVTCMNKKTKASEYAEIYVPVKK